MARIQYTSETSRIMRTDSAMMDVDASGCFDRIVPRLPTILNQANGSPQASASCRLDPTKSPITLHMGKTLNNEREYKNKQSMDTHPYKRKGLRHHGPHPRLNQRTKRNTRKPQQNCSMALQCLLVVYEGDNAKRHYKTRWKINREMGS